MEAHTLPVAVSLPEVLPPRDTLAPESLSPAAQVASRNSLSRTLLATADVFAAAFSLVLCITLLGGNDQVRAATLIGVLLVVPISKIIGLYERDEVLIHRTTLDEAPAIFQLATLYTVLVWLASPAVIEGTLGRDQGLGLWTAFFASAIVSRYVARRIAERHSPPERCLLVGDVHAAEQLTGTMQRDALRGYIVGRMDTTAWNEPNAFLALTALVQQHHVHRLIVAPDDSHPEQVLDLVRAAKGLGVQVSLLPRVLEVVGSNVEFDNLGGVPLLGVRPLKLSRSSLALKRAFDLALAGIALVIAAPLLAAVAVAVRLDSPGPAFFLQTRVGRDGKRFRMVKFRTMITGAHQMRAELAEQNEADGLFKIENDPRVTRVGHFLRRTSLDELPQLFNVLRGEMSLVGPRPLIVDEDAMITGLDRRRLNLTPGMTGHWQILGSARIPLSEMVKIDYLYVAGWSLWEDVKLLLRTVPYVLARRGM